MCHSFANPTKWTPTTTAIHATANSGRPNTAFRTKSPPMRAMPSIPTIVQ
jgi:hypothetical protein